MTDRFTFAHLTDAHLPTHGRFALAELLGERGLSALNWKWHRESKHVRAVADALRDDVLSYQPQHVAMTGDVVNFGLEREYLAGAEWLRSFGEPADVSFVPGNHESLQAGNEGPMRQAFAPFSTLENWPWVRVRGPVAFIGVSTSIPTPPGYAQGEIGGAQLQRLSETLETTRSSFRVILIHHPPTNLTVPSKELRDRGAFQKVVAEQGAELILHGHDHKNELSWIDRSNAQRIPVLGAPSASTPFGKPTPAEWRHMTLTKDGTFWRLRYLRRTLASSGAFEDTGRFNFRISS